MPTKTLLLMIGLILLTAGLLFAAMRVGQPKPSTQTPTPTAQQAVSLTPTPPAYTILEFSPNPVTVGTNGTGSVQVLINTDRNTATGVQLEIAYDPRALTNIVVTPGTFFQNPLIIPQWNKIDTQTGRISHAQVLSPSQEGVKGKGIIATITFVRATGVQLPSTQMTFLPKTAVTQGGVSASVLKSTTPVTILLGTPQVQVTQTVTQPLPSVSP